MASAESKIVANATCTFCGCLCDDIELTVSNDRISKAKNACVLGKAWFQTPQQNDRPQALIAGQPASLAQAVDRAAHILASARCPIVYGLSDTTCEAQQAAVALADRIGACIDTTASACHAPSTMAFQNVGEVTCSLGEVKNRADLVIFWGSDPVESHPRHWGRYSTATRGLFVPRGRKDRTVVVVDIRKSKSALAADIALQIQPAKDFEVLWILRGLLKGLDFSPPDVAGLGVSLAELRDLVQRMKACKFGVFFFGMGLALTGAQHLNVEAAFALVRDLNAHTRFYAKPMRARGNITGVDNVVCWQTGYPFAVSLQRGYPRYNPGEFTMVEMLTRGEPDAALIVCSDPLTVTNLPEAAKSNLTRIPYIAIDPKDTLTVRQAAVSFTTATYGIHTPGTAYRMDDVPLPLRPALRSPYPGDEQVLRLLERKIRELQERDIEEERTSTRSRGRLP